MSARSNVSSRVRVLDVLNASHTRTLENLIDVASPVRVLPKFELLEAFTVHLNIVRTGVVIEPIHVKEADENIGLVPDVVGLKLGLDGVLQIKGQGTVPSAAAFEGTSYLVCGDFALPEVEVELKVAAGRDAEKGLALRLE